MHVHHQPNPSIHSCRPRRLTKAYFHLQSSLGRTRWACITWRNSHPMPHHLHARHGLVVVGRRAIEGPRQQGPAAKIVGTRGGESRSTQAACAPGACVSHCTGTEGAAAGTDRRCFWPGSKNSGGIPRHHDKRAPLFNNVRAAARLPRSQDG